MLYYITIILTFAAWSVGDDGQCLPTKGEVWPKPQHQVKKDTALLFNHSQFQIKVVGISCPLLSSVIARYSNAFNQSASEYVRPNKSASMLAELRVDLTAPCEDYPQYGMDESYYLTIAEESTLSSGSIWGILRGLQTVLHSFYLSEEQELLINETEIFDYPRYSHRGLLLDTARHFISLPKIKETLDAMEMNKMNVFHWHIVDDESFPYQSTKFPELSLRAAFNSTMVYSKEDITLVVEYARERGIRVVPEFDVPGHTVSWKASYPHIVLTCRDRSRHVRGALNPTLNATYELLRELLHEARQLFPDHHFHVGGDEVLTECWEADPRIQYYLHAHEMKPEDLMPMFTKKLFRLLGTKKPIVWQEVFENVPSLPDNTTVQVWMSQGGDDGKRNLNKVLESGKSVILSAPWYLDDLRKSWVDYYSSTDLGDMANPALNGSVLGGEACMWSEDVHDGNLVSRVWPRASAVAEILWSSPPFPVTDPETGATRRRLEEQTRRMRARGVDADPRPADTRLRSQAARFLQTVLFWSVFTCFVL